jgi:hypothetical protein
MNPCGHVRQGGSRCSHRQRDPSQSQQQRPHRVLDDRQAPGDEGVLGPEPSHSPHSLRHPLL